jgi:photosystem II stability/assembly factor-like uncharacterized protein
LYLNLGGEGPQYSSLGSYESIEAVEANRRHLCAEDLASIAYLGIGGRTMRTSRYVQCTIALSLLLAGTMTAQWVQTNGPYGAAIRALAVSGSGLYAGTEGAGVFYTANSGLSWTQIDSGLVGNWADAILINGTNLFVGTYGGGVYLSTNNGISWIQANNGLTNYLIWSFAMIGSNLFAGTSDGVFLSSDNGSNWMAVNASMSGTQVNALASDGINLFAGTYGNGIYISTDNGTHWSAINTGLTTNRILSLVVKGADIFAGTESYGVFRSTDNGASWAVTTLTGSVNALASDGITLFAGTFGDGAFLSTDSGNSWTQVNNGLTNTDIRAIATNGSRLFAGSRGAGVFLSTNGGTNWTAVNYGLSMIYVQALAKSGQNLFAGTYGYGVFLSTDNGASWIEMNNGIPYPSLCVDAFAVSGAKLYAGTYGGGVYLSTNNGGSWTAVNTGLTELRVQAFEVNDRYLFAGTYGSGVFLSTNDGTTWSQVNNGLSGRFIDALARIGSMIFAASRDSGVFRSSDNGTNWQPVNAGLPTVTVRTLAVVGSNLFVATGSSGVYRSTDNGTNWQPVNTGLPFSNIVSFVASGPNLFAGNFGSGIFLTTNNGANWTTVSEGLPGLGVFAMAVDETNIFAGLSNGAWRRPLGEMLTSCSVSGTVFNDSNGNGNRDSSESGIAGWKVYLKNPDNSVIDSTVTPSDGSYIFVMSTGGTYTVAETQDTGWVQTAPPGLGTYTFMINPGTALTGRDFGNTHGYRYIGGGSGNWSDTSRWQGHVVPGPDKFVAIPPSVSVLVDALPNDSIRALRVESGGTLNFSSSVPRLKVSEKIQIDPSAVLTFPPSADSSGIICYGDWINRGTMSAGHSTIRFSGNQPKTIASESAPNIFYKLEISGDNTSTYGNITVANQLALRKTLVCRDQDSLIIENENINAVQDTGIILGGTIKRKIKAGETGTYRFESPSSSIKFSGPGTNPSSVSMASMPGRIPGNLLWEQIGGTVDTVMNTITADSIKKFTKWAFGIPKSTNYGIMSADELRHIDPVHRVYTIHSEGSTNFLGQLRLRYEQAEIPPGMSESNLKLWHGLFIRDSVSLGWNMISLPLIPDIDIKDSLFPTASSNAFVYTNGYMIQPHLQFGTGYWLKFPSSQQITFLGDDRDGAVIPLKAGWNIIGAISYPVDAAPMNSFPPNIVTSSFYGYKKGYQEADSLYPFHSYWVKASADGGLILSATGGSVLLKGNADHEQLRNFNTLIVADAAGNEQKLYYGKDEGIDVNRFELPPMPPEGMYDVRFATGMMLEVIDGKMKDIPLHIASAQYPVTIQWQLGNSRDIAYLRMGGGSVELQKNGKVQIKDSTMQVHLYLPSGPTNDMPKEYALEQNYPNPFNPSTTIKFQLPVKSSVTLRIYTILGQRVAELVNDIKPAGDVSVVWKTQNWNASGVYFYRLEATSVSDPSKTFTQVRKAILIR